MNYHRINQPTSIFLVIVLVSLLACAKAQTYNTSATLTSCTPNTNYSDNMAAYRNNTRTLLVSLPETVGPNGFYDASLGENPNRVHAIVLCRGDLQLDDCRSCVQNAAINIVQACPNYFQAILWHPLCMLRYSNESIVGTMDMRPAYYLWSAEISTNPYDFVYDLRRLLDNISIEASDDGSLRRQAYRRSAYGSISTVGFQTIYALEQCTPDLSPDDCSSCLSTAAEQLPRLLYGSIGGRILQPSCNLRYEISRFYNFSSDNTRPGNGNNTATRTVLIIMASVVSSLIVVGFIFFSIRKVNQKQGKEKEILDNEALDEISVFEAVQYDFAVIRSATCEFSEDNKLGQGGFGAVYKGKLQAGQEIAVKRLSKSSGQGDLEFKNEVMLLAKLQHRNLVRLYGFSLKGPEKLLVYEFVENASLDGYLFGPTRRSRLDWGTRYKIIGGIARGILYLHEDSRFSIIHRDLKAANILLDGEMNPKIADFGMARLFVPNEAEISTNRIVGTYGYMAPEYATRGEFSVKSDVFSFGVLLLEIISGQRNNFYRHGETKEDLISKAWRKWHNDAVSNLVDPILMEGLGIPTHVWRCIHISLLCVQENVSRRPTMASVVSMLNNISIDLPAPSHPPPYYSYVECDSQSSLPHESNPREGSFNNSTNNEGAQSGDRASINEMSISECYGR